MSAQDLMAEEIEANGSKARVAAELTEVMITASQLAWDDDIDMVWTPHARDECDVDAHLAFFLDAVERGDMVYHTAWNLTPPSSCTTHDDLSDYIRGNIASFVKNDTWDAVYLPAGKGHATYPDTLTAFEEGID